MSRPTAFAVIGSPVLHSASPRLFAAAFAQSGMDAVYTRLAATTGAQGVRLARGIGLRGFNVTAPFKEEVAGLCDALDETAAFVGAVNTVVVEDGLRLRGFNTDVHGVVAALEKAGARLDGARAFVLGAGGAAKAAVFGLRAAGASVTVLARDIDKARAFAQGADCAFDRIDAAAARREKADVLVSCLPPSAASVAEPFLRPGLFVLDANYHAHKLADAARGRECVVARGGDWLVAQGERAFRHFTGKEPPVGVMSEALLALRPKERALPPALCLTGFSGTGKSAVGQLLAPKLGKKLCDTDALVEREARMTVRELFEARGEAAFRNLERGAVAAAVRDDAVVALGGGALLDPDSRSNVASESLVVWLWSELQIAAERAANGARPLLDEPSRALALYEARIPGYLRAADLVLAADEGAPDDIAERIAHEVRRTFGG